MNLQVNKAISDKLSGIDSKKYPNVAKKIKFEAGKQMVINMVFNKLSQFKDWNFENAISDIEVNLMGLSNE